MKTTLPPSERDFDAFRLVKIEEKSTREAAAILEISQTRVCQIVQRVTEFLVEVAPVTISEETRAKQLNAARWIAAERANYLYGEAVRAWKASIGRKFTVRDVTVRGQKPVSTILNRESHGDRSYLTAANKCAEAAGRIGVQSWALGDYSAEVDPNAETPDATDPDFVATPKPAAGCATPPRPAPEPIRLQTGPVQPSGPLSPPPDSAPLPYKKLTPRDVQARRDFLNAS